MKQKQPNLAIVIKITTVSYRLAGFYFNRIFIVFCFNYRVIFIQGKLKTFVAYVIDGFIIDLYHERNSRRIARVSVSACCLTSQSSVC